MVLHECLQCVSDPSHSNLEATMGAVFHDYLEHSAVGKLLAVCVQESGYPICERRWWSKPIANQVNTHIYNSIIRSYYYNPYFLLIHCSYCVKCGSNKDINTYHCPDCDICIADFDHHCPWTGKCIGGGNMFLFKVFIISTMVWFFYSMLLLISWERKREKPPVRSMCSECNICRK